jgi:predicted nucleotidyltransferase component of viral defense system
MPRDFLHDHPQFADLIRIVAEEKSIDPALVEKDYWIMHCLYGLQRLGFTFQLKGGTSLSKGHQIINRFSEDIDILIEPPAARDVKVGKNQTARRRSRRERTFMTGSRKRSRLTASQAWNATRRLMTPPTTGAPASG